MCRMPEASCAAYCDRPGYVRDSIWPFAGRA